MKRDGSNESIWQQSGTENGFFQKTDEHMIYDAVVVGAGALKNSNKEKSFKK